MTEGRGPRVFCIELWMFLIAILFLMTYNLVICIRLHAWEMLWLMPHTSFLMKMDLCGSQVLLLLLQIVKELVSSFVWLLWYASSYTCSCAHCLCFFKCLFVFVQLLTCEYLYTLRSCILVSHLFLLFLIDNCLRKIILLQQIPSSREANESLADAIPKTKDGLIDWSQVSKSRFCNKFWSSIFLYLHCN